MVATVLQVQTRYGSSSQLILRSRNVKNSTPHTPRAVAEPVQMAYHTHNLFNYMLPNFPVQELEGSIPLITKNTTGRILN
jgi:hypothetical protein